MELGQQKSLHWKAFLLALVTATVMFLPFLIYNGGYFLFIGDFNVQQVPFYKLAHEAVRSGNLLWNWNTDLGVNFIGSYSFYLLMSPFFWLTLPFPTAWVPYFMGPLLILKTGCAALTSYLFIRRFVHNQNYAVLGSLLYAFSGFTTYNIFFNHFHEVIVFFPLLLLGLEMLLVDARKGPFAFAVAVNALVNYWFFIGEVVFVVLYFCVRLTSPDIRHRWKKFFMVAFESIAGFMVAAFIFLPSVLAILGNPRTEFSENTLNGWGFWLYWHEQRQPGIAASFFFPPEMASRPNMFPDHGAKWASLSAWLPLFSMTGVLAFLASARKNWLKKMLVLCFFVAMVPGLNSLFIALNQSYYARWFYMMVLLMATATVIALERQRVDIMRGFKWTAGITLGIVLAIGFTPKKNGDELVIGLASDMTMFWAYAAVAVVCLGLTYALIRYRHSRIFVQAAIICTCVVSAAFGIGFIASGKQQKKYDDWIVNTAIRGREFLNLDQSEFARSDFYDALDNLGMYWGLPNIQCFHSIVPPAIMEFYPSVGVKRDVSSKPETQYYALRSLLSVKWLFIEEEKENQEPMPGYTLVSKQLGFNIYENENFLPMGFAFDHYITEEQYEGTDKDSRNKLLMRALVLSDEQIERYGGVVTALPENRMLEYSYASFQDDVAALRARGAVSFEKDNRGFTSVLNLDRDSLVFYSVPYEAGWSATVNGEPAEVEKVDVGFMAVRVPAGEATVRFQYMTPGLKAGAVISLAGLVLLAGYLAWSVVRRRRGTPQPPHGQYRAFPEDVLTDEDIRDALDIEEFLNPQPDDLTPEAGEDESFDFKPDPRQRLALDRRLEPDGEGQLEGQLDLSQFELEEEPAPADMPPQTEELQRPESRENVETPEPGPQNGAAPAGDANRNGLPREQPPAGAPQHDADTNPPEGSEGQR